MKRTPAKIAGCIAAGLFLAVLATSSGEQSSLTTKKDGETAEAARIRALEESLLAAKAEAEYFRREWTELRLKDEALGIDVLTGDQQATHEKFVRALSELYQSEKRRQTAEDALKNLVGAAEALQKAGATDKVAKLESYQVALRQAQEVLQGRPLATMKTATDLTSLSVVSVDETLALVIVNGGRTQNVKVGMPFYLLRKDQVIGKCRIIEVREYLSAALIEGMQKKQKPRAGDRLLLAATKE